MRDPSPAHTSSGQDRGGEDSAFTSREKHVQQVCLGCQTCGNKADRCCAYTGMLCAHHTLKVWLRWLSFGARGGPCVMWLWGLPVISAFCKRFAAQHCPDARILSNWVLKAPGTKGCVCCCCCCCCCCGRCCCCLFDASSMKG